MSNKKIGARHDQFVVPNTSKITAAALTATSGLGDQVQQTAPEPSELKLDAPHDHLVMAATSKTKAAALTTAWRLPDKAQQNSNAARGPPDQLRPWLLSDRQVGVILDMSRASVWRRVADGTLPKPVKIGGLSRWVSVEIEAAVLRAMAQRGEGC